MTDSSLLQRMIFQVPDHGTLDISGLTFNIDKDIKISKPITLRAYGTKFVTNPTTYESCCGITPGPKIDSPSTCTV